MARENLPWRNSNSIAGRNFLKILVTEIEKTPSKPDISESFLWLSLTPGFSPVETGDDEGSRFNGFLHRVKAADAGDIADWNWMAAHTSARVN